MWISPPIWTTSFGISSAYSNTAFPRISAHVVMKAALLLISAHPLGHDSKQASLSKKRPLPYRSLPFLKSPPIWPPPNPLFNWDFVVLALRARGVLLGFTITRREKKHLNFGGTTQLCGACQVSDKYAMPMECFGSHLSSYQCFWKWKKQTKKQARTQDKNFLFTCKSLFNLFKTRHPFFCESRANGG